MSKKTIASSIAKGLYVGILVGLTYKLPLLNALLIEAAMISLLFLIVNLENKK